MSREVIKVTLTEESTGFIVRQRVVRIVCEPVTAFDDRDVTVTCDTASNDVIKRL